MIKFIYTYIDMMALALTAIFPLIITVRLKKRAGEKLRFVPSYLLVFGPCGTIAFIFFHLFENIYRAILGLANGTFLYTFRFYALVLVGVVVAYLGFTFLAVCQRKCLGMAKANRGYFIWLLLLLAFTMPQVPLISIAAVPFFCCVISLLGFGFVHRKKAVCQQPGKKPRLFRRLDSGQVPSFSRNERTNFLKLKSRTNESRSSPLQ